MSTQNILIEFSSDIKGITTAEQAVQSLGIKDKELKETFNKTNTAIKEREKTLDKAGGSVATYAGKLKLIEKAATGAFGVKALKEFEAAGNKAFKSIIAGSTNATKSLKGMEKELQAGVNDALKEAGVSAEEFEQALKDSGITADEFAQKLSEGVAGSKEFGNAVEGVDIKAKSFKTQLKELKNGLQEMEAAGQEGTEQFKEMSIAAAKLEDQIGDTAERVRVLSSDTANVDAAVEGIQLLATGFQLAAGTAQLMGVGEENVQKALVKLNAVMAVTQGIQQALNFLRGQSILKQKLEVAQNVILAASTRATAATYTALGISVEASSFAFKALRTAIITTGVGALLVGLGFLVSKIIEWTGATNEQEAAQARLNDQVERSNGMLERNLSTLDRITERTLLNLRLNGASEAALLKARTDGRNRQIDEIKDHILRTEQLDLDAFKKGEERDKEELRRENEKAADEEKIANLQFDNEKDRAELKIKFQEDFAKEQEDLEKKNAEKRADNAKKAEDQAKRNAVALAEIIRLGLQLQADAAKEVAENETLGFEVRNNAALRYIELQKELIENEYKLAIAGEKTGNEIKLATDQRQAAIEKINRESAQIIYKVWKDNNKQIVDLIKAPDIEDATKEQANELLKIVDDGLKAEVKKIEEGEKKKADIRRAIKGAVIQAVIEGENAAFEIGADRRQKELDDALSKIDILKNAELSAKNLTEQDKDEINKKYAVKERVLKLKAFEEDKKAKRAQAFISGALAIIQAFAQLGPIAGAIAAFGIAVTTGINIAKINATQPGFKKGGYTGNKGRDEIAGVTHGQEFVAHAEATKKYKPALEAMNKGKFEDYIAAITPKYPQFDVASMSAMPDWAIGTQTSLEIDYDRMGTAIAAKMPAPVTNQISMDEHGFTKSIIEKGNRINILNNRYKF